MKNLKLYKQYKNIPRFYDGSEPTSSNYNGRRLGYNYMTGLWNGSNAFANTGTDSTATNLSGFSATPGSDLKDDINQAKSLNTANTTNLISNVGNAAITGATSMAALSQMSGNAAKAAGANLLSSLDDEIVSGGVLQASQLGGNGTSTAGSSVLSTAGNVLGAVGGLAGAAMGGMQFGQGLKSFGNVLGSDVLDKATNYGTEQIGDRTYKVNNGYDQNAVNDLLGKQITGAKLQTTLGGLGTGMGVGAAAGSIGALAGAGTGAAAGSVLPGIGTAIGAGIGLLAGGIASIFGGKSAKRKAEEAKRKFAMQQNATNMQEEAVAGNAAAKDNYYGAADKGKNVGESLMKYNMGKTMTTSGPQYGLIKGLASPDEGMVNMATGETQYNGNPNPYVKDPRRDVIPVGGEGFDENVGIPGHEVDYTDPYGRTYADIARPLFKVNELIKNSQQLLLAQYQKQTEDNNNNKHRNDTTREYMLKRYDLLYQQQTALLQQLYQLNSEQLLNIVNRQSMLKEYVNSFNADYGKNYLPKFKFGWPEVNGTDVVNGFASWLALNKEADIIRDKGNLTQLNVLNKYADKALQELGNIHYNPDADLQALTNADRQNLYNIRSASNLSSGQRAALANTSANQNRALRYNIAMDAFNKNAGYRTAYANALMQAGEAQANRDYNAQALYEQQRIAQNASYVTNHLNHYKNIMNQIGNISQNISGRGYNNKLLDLYAKDIEIRANLNKGTTTTSLSPEGYNSLNDAFNEIKSDYTKKSPFMYVCTIPQDKSQKSYYYNVPWGGALKQPN